MLVLLALSGMLVLVPIAAPVHATQNASLPTLTVGTNAYITGTLTAGTTLMIANPITNSYAITSITIFTPTKVAFTTGTAAAGLYLNSLSVDTATAETFSATGAGLAPGFTTTITLGSITSSVASPATAAPPTSTFSTTLIDGGSSPASYPGPTWSVYTLASGTSITSVSGNPTSYVAGSAASTVTATLSTNQPGVPITFAVTTPAHSGFSSTVSPSSTVTVAGATVSTATTSFAPSNHAGDSTTISATVGVSLITQVSGATTTVAGGPASVAWTYGATAFGVGKNLYLTSGVSGVSFAATHYSGTTVEAIYGIATPLTVAVSDAFGNSLAFGALTNPSVTVTAPAGIGGWDSGAATVVNPITCTTALNTGISCSGGNAGQFLYPYAQTYNYGTTTVLQATITGSYNSVPFSVAATSGNIITGTQATGLTLTVTGSPTYGVGTTVTLQAAPNAGTQPGVPVTFNLCGQQKGATVCLSPATTSGYGGSFAGGAQTGYVSNTGGVNGYATATYTLPTVLGQVGNFNASAPAPNGATPTPTITAPAITLSQTVAGAAVGFKVNVYFDSAATTAVKSSLVSGQNVYVVVALIDAYGNNALNTGATQLQITLTATAGSLFATTLYISSGQYNTQASPLGVDEWTVPSTVSIGSVVTLTATGAVTTGTKSITIVSPIPTINLKKGSLNGPVIASGTTIYSPTGALTFYSKANASAGYSPATTTIASIGTKIGTSPYVTTLTPNTYTSANTFSLFFPTGLSTLSVNASDNNVATGAKFGNVGTDGPFNILVDPYLPTFTIGTPVAGAGSDTVTVVSTEGDFNTTTFAATYGGVAVPSSSISWSGTQTLGSMSTLTATISGLTAGTNTLAVSGKTDAGLSGSASGTITITIVFANSVTFTTGSATWGNSGAAQGVFVPVTNSWNTALQLTIYVTMKSGTTSYTLVGGETLAAGQTATVFCQDFLTTVPVGTYTVTFSSITTSNTVPSGPTTPITLTS